MKHKNKSVLYFVLILCSFLTLLLSCGEGNHNYNDDVEIGEKDMNIENERMEADLIKVMSPSFTAKKYTITEDNSDCPNGGELIEMGMDMNGDGILEPSEVNVKKIVCK